MAVQNWEILAIISDPELCASSALVLNRNNIQPQLLAPTLKLLHSFYLSETGVHLFCFFNK